jgi:hypothetical protein
MFAIGLVGFLVGAKEERSGTEEDPNKYRRSFGKRGRFWVVHSVFALLPLSDVFLKSLEKQLICKYCFMQKSSSTGSSVPSQNH